MILKKMKWFIAILIVFAIFIVFFVSKTIMANFSNHHTHILRKRNIDNVLLITPPGTSMEDTINIIKKTHNNEFGIHYIDYEHGYALSENPYDEKIIGLKSVIGYFRVITEGYVFERSNSSKETIFWVFDEDSNLIDVFIW